MNQFKIPAKAAGLLACAVLSVALASPAIAASDESDQPEVVVVTGSRLPQTEFTSPDPIQVLTSEDALAQGLPDTASLLRTSTVAAGSFQQTIGLTNFGLPLDGQGAQTVSLRGLDAQRTLVILNGRRAGPAGIGGSVAAFDLSVLPSSLIDRVEILKDGASSIYGSDAIAGVVNIITKKRFEGGTIEVFGTQPFESGGEQYRVSGSYGWVFDKGYFNISGEYFRQNMLHTGDRSYLSCSADVLTNVATGLSADVIDPMTHKPKCFEFPVPWGAAIVPGIGQLQYDPTDAYGPYTASAANPYYGLGWRKVNIAQDIGSLAPARFKNPIQDGRSAIQQSDVYTAFLQGGYDFSQDVQAYGELLFNHRVAASRWVIRLLPVIAATQASNPFGTTARPNLELEQNAKSTVDYVRAVGGLKGKFHGIMEGWNWDLWTEASFSRGEYNALGINNNSVLYSDGNLANGECGGAVTETPISHLPCTPIDWFSATKMSTPRTPFTAAEAAFLFQRAIDKTSYDQVVVEGSVTGSLFTLPAGDVGAAFGFQYRHDSIDDEPPPSAQVFNLVYGNGTATKGSDTATELFGELGIPILAEDSLIGSVDASVSGRFVDYKSSGSNTTYKVGLNWQPFPWLRLRATDGTSFRAPALFEQYQGYAALYYPQYIGYDPCINWQLSPSPTIQANCAADGVPPGLGYFGPNALEVRGGSSGLKPETSEAMTIGFVLTPEFANFNLAVDYFEITVKNELSYYNSNQVGLCYASPNFPTDPLCSLFTRDPVTHYVDYIDDHYVNISIQHERGIDVSAQYQNDFNWFRFTASGNLTYKLQDDRILFAGGPTTDRLNRIGYPAFVANSSFTFERGDWAFTWTVDFYGHASDVEDTTTVTSTHSHTAPGTTVMLKDYTEATWYHTATLRWTLKDWVIRAGIQNLFDEHPPAVSSNQIYRRGISALPNYDLIGRRAFVDVTVKF